ncbi:hypothetical protein [Acinetobacter puyangensis]|uniref:hypothetical protein n=1 Tax=Acinetobacter puyangensis TaxID=1096779 RepID=UPI003A4E57B3
MFILSSNKKLEPELSNFDRLYAYPNLPNITPEHMIILDSGAFALSCKNQKMDDEYIQNLARHYEQYVQHENVYFVAPDVFKCPELSMRQFLYFKQICNVDAAPVIQFRSPVADLFDAKVQIKFYKEHAPNLRLICISNHAFNIGAQATNIDRIVKMIRYTWGMEIKIHVLGAGFNSKNVADWVKTGVTSMDSVSYYSDAQVRQQWVFGQSYVVASSDNFKLLALKNAEIAASSAKNYKVFP